jgi:hypothetical protein
MGIPIGQTVVDFDVETQGEAHRERLIAELRRHGYQPKM